MSVSLFNATVGAVNNVQRHQEGKTVSIRLAVYGVLNSLMTSINVDISILSHILNTATREGIIDKNPCREVKRLKVTQTKDRVLNSEEIALLLDTLQGKDRVMVLVGLFTGLRLGGVLGLKWQDVDFDKGLIASSHKTGKLVSIPLSSYLADELMRYKASCNSENLFEDREIKYTIVQGYSEYFSKLFKGLDMHNFTFHNLRHSFSSLLQSELGVGAVVVQGMTGHSSLGMLQKYSHSGLDSEQRAIQALTNYVLGVSNKLVIPIVSKTGTA